jgi:large subunit ribosomal protein L24e
MPKCSFSGDAVAPGTGRMCVLKDGKILYFKNSKCKKNFLKLKRVPRKVRWTQAYRVEHKKGVAAQGKKVEESKKEAALKKEVKEQPKAEPIKKKVTKEAAKKSKPVVNQNKAESTPKKDEGSNGDGQ